MKYAVALAALAAVVAAQDPSIIPECARECLLKATASASSCQAGDYACTCLPENKAAISNAATSCVVGACGVDKALNEVLPASDKLCAAAGAGSGAASSAAPSAPAAAPAPATSSAAASVSIPTSAPGSASLPVITGSVTPVPLPSVVTTTTRPATTRASNGTATGSPASTSVVQAGAAGLGSIGGLAMLVLGALAL
ncbi:hypothetical protein C8034_v011980 [Colletotrichum sidae]|uniref:CFEM domain-containing protein n=2 Tax=Colletotrichum orbiculare species complex TaxID=2707354 RepID=A0A4V3HS02_9PEZI|nr:hypothetical protein C8035_v010953 [Colletotrichum spinosum]TEA18817.1 hypothetical protein C8034_v011980 [Colletotrichum sidae]